MLGKIKGRSRRGQQRSHRLNGHEFEQTPGDSEGQGSLACCSPWGHKELDTTKWLNNNIYMLKNNMGGGKGINIYQQKKGDHLQICVWFLFTLSNLKPLLLLLPSLVKKKSVGFQILSCTPPSSPPIISLLTFCLTLGQLLNLTKLQFPNIQIKFKLSVMVRVILSVIIVNFRIFRGLTQEKLISHSSQMTWVFLPGTLPSSHGLIQGQSPSASSYALLLLSRALCIQLTIKKDRMVKGHSFLPAWPGSSLHCCYLCSMTTSPMSTPNSRGGCEIC